MDITSYLLGKNSSGGGGGSTGLDWSSIGCNNVPPVIEKDYNYSKSIYDNWSVGDMRNKFANNINLTYMPLVDTTNTNTSYSGMFDKCINLKCVPAIIISSNATTVDTLFRGCNSLIEIDSSNFDFTNVTNYTNMFNACSSLEYLDLSTIKNATKNANLYQLFYNCTNLKEVNLSGLNFAPTDISSMFYNCTSLTKIDMRNLTFSASSYSTMFYKVPTDCLIIVKDATEKAWINTKFPTMTNVKTVEEYENN